LKLERDRKEQQSGIYILSRHRTKPSLLKLNGLLFPTFMNKLMRRPEAHERIREWVTPHECLARIQAWSNSPATAGDIAAQGGVVVESKSKKAGKEGSKAKRDKKSGAMEMALRQFVDLKGWEKGV
jgi:hypothetical protein